MQDRSTTMKLKYSIPMVTNLWELFNTTTRLKEALPRQTETFTPEISKTVRSMVGDKNLTLKPEDGARAVGRMANLSTKTATRRSQL